MAFWGSHSITDQNLENPKGGRGCQHVPEPRLGASAGGGAGAGPAHGHSLALLLPGLVGLLFPAPSWLSEAMQFVLEK